MKTATSSSVAITEYLQPKPVVVYARVSTKEQGSGGLGIAAQISACERVIDTEKWHLVATYTEVISGKTPFPKRATLQAAITHAKATGASLLIARLDRLSRNIAHTIAFIHDPKAPPLVLADRPGASEFEINILASLAQEERRLISTRTKEALAAKKAQGWEPGCKGTQAFVEKTHAATEGAINRALELKSQGLGVTRITAVLNEEGYKTSRGTQWSKQALSLRLKAISS